MSKQTRYDLNALILLVLLGAATAADAQVDQQRGPGRDDARGADERGLRHWRAWYSGSSSICATR